MEDEKEKNLHFLRSIFLALRALAWEQLGVDVRYDTTLGDNDVAQEFVQPEVVEINERSRRTLEKVRTPHRS